MTATPRVAVFFDEIPFLGDPNGGIARANVALAKELGACGLPVLALGFRCSCFLAESLRTRPSGVWLMVPWVLRKSSLLRNLVRRTAFWIFRRRLGSGFRVVYHSVGIGSDSWIAQRSDAHVVTIHDCIPERLDSPRRKTKTSAIHQRKESLQTAQGLIWVSGKTRRDFRRFYPSVSLPGRVVGHGKSLHPLPDTSSKKREHFLLVGNRQGYKNAVTVYRALTLFHPKVRPRLQLVGGGPPSPEERQLWKDLGITRSVRWARCTERELSWMYARAIAVLVPSTIEGFGFPALEAMTHGRAVICLRHSGVDEVVGRAGLILKKNHERAFFGAMKYLLGISTRKKFEKEAALRAEMFDWHQAAEKIIFFYKQLLGP